MTRTDAREAVPVAPLGRPARRRPSLAWILAGAAVAAALVVVAVVALVAGGGTRFEVRDQFTGEVYYSRPFAVGETFDMEHTHSVSHRLVVETFSALDEETIAIEEMRFDRNGPNLPTGSERIGEHETTFSYEEDGSYRVIHHSYPLGTVPLVVSGASVDRTLTFADGDRVRLLDVAEQGAAVEFVVRPG